jgi:Protein of unknown function (DUF3828)
MKTLTRIVLLLALLLAPATPAARAQASNQSAQAAAGSPEAVVRGFYAFYLGELNKDNWEPLKKRREALKYLTPEFHRRIPGLTEKWMADVIICAQDWDANWAKNFTVGRSTVRGAKAITVVRLPPFGGAGPGIDIKLTLVKRGGAWKINGSDCVN